MNKKETNIIVTDFIEDILCIDSVHGEKIGNKILEYWNDGYIVTLDFEGVNLLFASFINSMYAVLSQNFTLDEIRQKLKYSNLNKVELSEIQRCEKILSVHNAKNEELRHIIEQLTEGK